MKKIFSLVFLALLGAGTMRAAMKKSDAFMDASRLTVIVMDSTQALLDHAKVKVGTEVYVTSYDGRVLIPQEQLKGVKKIIVDHISHIEQEIACADIPTSGEALLVYLAETEVPYRDEEPRWLELGSATPKATAYRAVPTMAPGEDGFYVEEPVMMPDMKEDVSELAPVPNSAQAGLLTAGEVNDFAKWYFWPTVLDDTHTEYIPTWKITPRHRYTVQVMNKAGFPMASRAVALLDKNGNTLFQAMTDNTGKAELWYGLLLNKNGEEPETGKLRIQVEDQTQDAKEQPEGMNTFVLDEACEVSDAVDVVFVFDATGSMGDELQYLQAEMKDVIARAKDATGGLNIRTGAIVYRDHGDQYLTRLSRLTEDISETQAFIERQHASGGGDYPEAVPEALMAALNCSGWNEHARARIAFLILDAPCHDGKQTIALLHEQILNAAAMGVRIVPVVCSGLGESGEFLLRSIALATNGTSFFLTDDSGIGNTHLQPTTDSLKVEHLNDMLVRTIVEFSTMSGCQNDPNDQMVNDEMVNNFIPNPFDANDLEHNPEIPHGQGVHYLVDVSGKLLGIYEGDNDQLPMTHYQLPIGVYFIKTFYDGKWYTKKIFVR